MENVFLCKWQDFSSISLKSNKSQWLHSWFTFQREILHKCNQQFTREIILTSGRNDTIYYFVNLVRNWGHTQETV